MSHHHPHHHHTRQRPHHLSASASGGDDAHGWVESIMSLKQDHAATGLLTGPAATAAGQGNVDVAAGQVQVVEPYEGDSAAAAIDAAAAASAAAAPPLSPEEEFEACLEHSLGLLQKEVDEVGETVLAVGLPGGWGPSHLTAPQRDEVLARVAAMAKACDAGASVLRERKVDLPLLRAAAGGGGGTVECHAADVLLRRQPGAKPAIEIRVAIIGNVDSGKSTMVGVMTRSILDDGRGLARSKVFKHDHEAATGRTSSIGQHNLCLDSTGHVLNDPMFRNQTCGDYISRSSKVVTLVDLAGHEKYFRTTAYGLTGHLPDYACLIVGANMGVVGMCKEHLGVALALKVPVFFVITKVDICPEHVLKNTLMTLSGILKKPGVKKKPFLVRTMEDVLLCARNMDTDSLAPIILCSAVTGKGLDLVRMFLNLLPQRMRWADRQAELAEFCIDEAFSVPGVGTVVAGTVKRGVISNSSALLMGPDIGDGTFRSCSVKSIHYKRLPVAQVVAGQTAALALKKVKRNQVRKGMVLVDERVHPSASWEFDADIAILTHSTTIQPRYQAVIHCEIIRQAARVVAMDKERLRSGDRAYVRFRFLQRPEYIQGGVRFVFREGRTKGIGVIVGPANDGVTVAPVKA